MQRFYLRGSLNGTRMYIKAMLAVGFFAFCTKFMDNFFTDLISSAKNDIRRNR